MKYFTIAELCKSTTADRRGINNKCTMNEVKNLTALVENVLDPLRQAYGKPIRVNSGFRSYELNRAVRGAVASDHLYGRAADIVGTPATKEENEKLFNLVRSLGLPFKQLINEKDFSWVHVSYDQTNNKKQILNL